MAPISPSARWSPSRCSRAGSRGRQRNSRNRAKQGTDHSFQDAISPPGNRGQTTKTGDRPQFVTGAEQYWLAMLTELVEAQLRFLNRGLSLVSLVSSLF